MSETPAIDVTASLRLADVEGVGAIGYARLIDIFGSALAVLNASPEQLQTEAEVHAKLALRISQTLQSALPAHTAQQLRWVEDHGALILPLEDERYPPLLRTIADPPSLLYILGDPTLLHLPGVAVVGSRRISSYGRYVTRKLCTDLATTGVVVVSGMASGVDGQAHLAALAAQGKTVAVLGTGLARPYPAEHKGLFQKIAQAGVVISEFSPDTPPSGPNFPRRNRIISGLSLGVIVVEAGLRSGSLITARLASEQGRTVFAVPGNIDQPGAEGCHHLIRQGATLISHASEVVADLLPQWQDRAPAATTAQEAVMPEGLPPLQQQILGLLGSVSVSADDLSEQLQAVDTATLLGALLELEMGGLLEKMPGNRYVRPPRRT